MKTSHILFATLVSLASASASAQMFVKTDAERDHANLNAGESYPILKFESTKTRAEVIAELEAARRGPHAAAAEKAGSATKSGKAQNDKPQIEGKAEQNTRFDAGLYKGA